MFFSSVSYDSPKIFEATSPGCPKAFLGCSSFGKAAFCLEEKQGMLLNN